MDFACPSSLVGLVGNIGCPQFAKELMSTLRAATGADLVSAFEFSEFKEPLYLLGAGCSGAEARFTQTAGIKYANGYWKHDPAVSSALADASGSPCRIYRQYWNDIPHREYRAYCYESHDVLERVSVFDRSGKSPVLLNLYRYKASGRFDADGLDLLERSGGFFGALVAKHAEITGSVARSGIHPDVAMVARVLRRADLGLSTQEVEVCASLLAGLSYKEIAERRSLQISSVITYRKRAYLKLGIRNRIELTAAYETATRRAWPSESPRCEIEASAQT